MENSIRSFVLVLFPPIQYWISERFKRARDPHIVSVIRDRPIIFPVCTWPCRHQWYHPTFQRDAGCLLRVADPSSSSGERPQLQFQSQSGSPSQHMYLPGSHSTGWVLTHFIGNSVIYIICVLTKYCWYDILPYLLFRKSFRLPFLCGARRPFDGRMFYKVQSTVKAPQTK